MKNNKNSVRISLFVVAALTMSLPFISFASTYAYVNQSGQINTVIANSPEIALVTAPGIAPYSGVMLVSDTTPATLFNTDSTAVSSSRIYYMYVNESGIVVSVMANSSAMAFDGSLNIDNNSGVMLINSLSDSQVVGDFVSGT